MTDWSGYSVWQLASFLDEDLGPLWEQATAWPDTVGLLDLHRQTLTRVRDQLAQAWPPEHSPAAARFLAELDALTASITDTLDKIGTIGVAIAGVASTLDQAKQEMIPLLEQAQWGGSGEFAAHVDAQTLMARTDQTVFEYTRLMPPIDVLMDDPRPDIRTPLDVPPMSARGGGSRVEPPPVPPPKILPPDHLPIGELGSDGESLAGLPAAARSVAGSGESAGVQPSPSHAGAGSARGGWIGSAAVQIGEGSRTGVVVPAPRLVSPDGPAVRGPGAPAATARETAGPNAATGPGRAGAAAGEPVDGSAHPGAFLPGVGGVAGGRDDQVRYRAGGRDYIWPIKTGFPPVIEPPPEPVHDPGPGVIGIDR